MEKVITPPCGRCILGYSRDHKGNVIGHNFKLLSNTITAMRRDNTMFYVVEIWKRNC